MLQDLQHHHQQQKWWLLQKQLQVLHPDQKQQVLLLELCGH
jgi:hypothetical protein